MSGNSHQRRKEFRKLLRALHNLSAATLKMKGGLDGLQRQTRYSSYAIAFKANAEASSEFQKLAASFKTEMHRLMFNKEIQK